MATVIAKETVRVAGSRALVVKNASYDDKDPVVKANPGLFSSPEEAQKRQRKPQSTAELGEKSMSTRKRTKKKKVEQATAAPGEQRDIEYACDDCDYTTTSEHGLKVHASKAHG